MPSDLINFSEGRLLRIPFTTVFDYILLLRAVAQELQARRGPAFEHRTARCSSSLTATQVCGRDALFYLAAAVSDFYVPWCGALAAPFPFPHLLVRAGSLDAWMRRRDLPEHKIQSDPAFAGVHADTSTGLTLTLRPVPKFLGTKQVLRASAPRSNTT